MVKKVDVWNFWRNFLTGNKYLHSKVTRFSPKLSYTRTFYEPSVPYTFPQRVVHFNRPKNEIVFTGGCHSGLHVTHDAQVHGYLPLPLPPWITDIGPPPLPCHWHLVVITGDMGPATRCWHMAVITEDVFKLVHLRTYPHPILTSRGCHWSGRYASYWDTVLFLLVGHPTLTHG